MAVTVTDTSPLFLVMDPFRNPLGDTPFLKEEDIDMCNLFQFKDVVVSWTLKIVRGTLLIMHREEINDVYIPLHQNVRVAAFEQHRSKYLLIRCHQHFLEKDKEVYEFGIIVEVGSNCGAQFDPEGFLDHLRKTQHGFLASWEKIVQTWGEPNAEDQTRRLGRLITNLSKMPIATKRKASPIEPGMSAPDQSVQTDNQDTSVPVQGADQPAPTQTTRKRLESAIPDDEPSPQKKKRKRARSVPEPPETEAGPSEKKKEKDDGIDWEQYAKDLTAFEEEYNDSFLFQKKPKPVLTEKLIRGKAVWTIRAYEDEIRDKMKIYLATLGEIRARQTLVVTPIQDNGELLHKKPTTWEQIKDGKFAIIDGQHSVEAARELLKENLPNKSLRSSLETWDAYIVYDKDPARLTAISAHYNNTNPLTHAQPTWGNQIHPGRSIWIDCGRPANAPNESERRLNASVYKQKKYKVIRRFHISFFCNFRLPFYLPNSCEIYPRPGDNFHSFSVVIYILLACRYRNFHTHGVVLHLFPGCVIYSG